MAAAINKKYKLLSRVNEYSTLTVTIPIKNKSSSMGRSFDWSREIQTIQAATSSAKKENESDSESIRLSQMPISKFKLKARMTPNAIGFNHFWRIFQATANPNAAQHTMNIQV